jgi:hypothetical protein
VKSKLSCTSTKRTEGVVGVRRIDRAGVALGKDDEFGPGIRCVLQPVKRLGRISRFFRAASTSGLDQG